MGHCMACRRAQKPWQCVVVCQEGVSDICLLAYGIKQVLQLDMWEQQAQHANLHPTYLLASAQERAAGAGSVQREVEFTHNCSDLSE